MVSIKQLLICGVLSATATFGSATDSCNAIAGETGSSCAATAEQLTVDEEREAEALHMELLQTNLKHGKSSSELKVNDGKAVADSVADTKTRKLAREVREKENAASASNLVSKDHNDNLCMLCGKPLPERLNKTYTELRKDCGGMTSPKGPDAAILKTPAVRLTQVAEDGTERNGFCQLNFAKSCVDAVANKDYLYWAKSLDLNSTSARANAAFDGRYCRLNGFLEPSMVALQHDFHATQAKARELCKTKYAKYKIDKISFMDMMSSARYDDASAPTEHEAELLAAWNCAMGDLGCDLSLCAYSFCATDEGTGLYDECKGWHPIHGMPMP